jgi:hypothetical protein
MATKRFLITTMNSGDLIATSMNPQAKAEWAATMTFASLEDLRTELMKARTPQEANLIIEAIQKDGSATVEF